MMFDIDDIVCYILLLRIIGIVDGCRRKCSNATMLACDDDMLNNIKSQAGKKEMTFKCKMQIVKKC